MNLFKYKSQITSYFLRLMRIFYLKLSSGIQSACDQPVTWLRDPHQRQQCLSPRRAEQFQFHLHSAPPQDTSHSSSKGCTCCMSLTLRKGMHRKTMDLSLQSVQCRISINNYTIYKFIFLLTYEV